MKKLAYAYAGSFEMPKLRVVGLEKDANVMLSQRKAPVTIYKVPGLSDGSLTRVLEFAEMDAITGGSSADGEADLGTPSAS